MGGFLLGYNPSALPQLPLGKEGGPTLFGQQMSILSCNVISSSAFFVPPPSTPALLLVDPKGCQVNSGARLRLFFTQIKGGFVGSEDPSLAAVPNFCCV